MKNMAWLATDVYVAPGTTIKDGVVVGAGGSIGGNSSNVWAATNSGTSQRQFTKMI